MALRLALIVFTANNDSGQAVAERGVLERPEPAQLACEVDPGARVDGRKAIGDPADRCGRPDAGCGRSPSLRGG